MPKPLLIYDGECPLCQRAVGWLRAHCPPDSIEFMACQDPTRPLRAPDVSDGMCLEAMQWIGSDGTRRAGAEALPGILRRAPAWAWLAAILEAPPLRWATPFLYRWVARHRFALSGVLRRKGSPAACRPGEGCDL